MDRIRLRSTPLEVSVSWLGASKREVASEQVIHSLFRRRFRRFCRVAICHSRPLSRLRPSQQCRAHQKSKLDRSAQSSSPDLCCLLLVFPLFRILFAKCQAISEKNQVPSRKRANAKALVSSAAQPFRERSEMSGSPSSTIRTRKNVLTLKAQSSGRRSGLVQSGGRRSAKSRSSPIRRAGVIWRRFTVISVPLIRIRRMCRSHRTPISVSFGISVNIRAGTSCPGIGPTSYPLSRLSPDAVVKLWRIGRLGPALLELQRPKQ